MQLHFFTWIYMTFSTDIATPQKSARLSNLHCSVFRGTNSHWDFGLIWMCTEEFKFLDLVTLGGVALQSQCKLSYAYSANIRWFSDGNRHNCDIYTFVNALLHISVHLKMHFCIHLYIRNMVLWIHVYFMLCVCLCSYIYI